MAKQTDPLLDYLRTLLDEASAWLPGVTSRQMFGCYALFAGGNIYAFVWNDGRIALRLSDPEPFAEMIALPGTDRWTLGDKPMNHWLLVPESFHDDTDLLRSWVTRAHVLAAILPPSKLRRKPAKAAAAKE